MSYRQRISFTLNGRAVEVDAPAEMNTITMLREKFDLTGTKLGCGEGECGACTILVDGISVNSCLMFAVDCDGRELTTIEGLLTEEGLNTLQQEFVANGAAQCGFCTPGMIMQGTHLLNQNRDLTIGEIKRGIEGNLCRCTGYKKVIEAIAAAIRKTNGTYNSESPD
jgi:carbon-monoxide dehydrogenase small subunit